MATFSIARTMFFFACVSESKASNSCKAQAASTVPAQVRKSLAVNSSPEIAQIVVDVGRVDGVACAVVIEVLEQLLTGQILAALDDPSQPTVLDINPMAQA